MIPLVSAIFSFKYTKKGKSYFSFLLLRGRKKNAPLRSKGQRPVKYQKEGKVTLVTLGKTSLFSGGSRYHFGTFQQGINMNKHGIKVKCLVIPFIVTTFLLSD